jgi:mannose-6-phosphate isomerase-like protein (cupin superfamily)
MTPNTPAVSTSASALVEPDAGARLRLGPLEILVKEDGGGTRGNLAVAEFRGTTFRIPPHSHTDHDETIHVLEGELGVRLGDETFVARAGSSFTIPVGVVHSVWNETGSRVRFLNVIVPGRYLDYFRELAAAAAATPGALPPPAEIGRIMGRYGLVPEPPGPPPGGPLAPGGRPK